MSRNRQALILGHFLFTSHKCYIIAFFKDALATTKQTKYPNFLMILSPNNNHH